MAEVADTLKKIGEAGAAVERPLKGWWLIIAAAVIGALGTVQATGLATVVPPNLVGPTMMLISLVVGGLRVLTGGPLGQGTPPVPDVKPDGGSSTPPLQ